jgi:hypothetical protein
VAGVRGACAALAFALLLPAAAARAEAPLVPTRDARGVALHDRMYDQGATLVRFERDRFHFALVLDARPAKVEEKRITLEDGRTIEFRWSTRSLWIAGEKFELPFGDVILVSARDSIRARALEFRAVRGEIMLNRLMADPGGAAWIEAYGTSGAAPVRQDAQSTTEPRHTTEVAEWSWRGLHGLTFVLSGEPLFVLLADRPMSSAGTRTSFGGFDRTEVRIGALAGDRLIADRKDATFELRAGADHPRERAFKLSDGRAFLIAGDAVRQVNVPFEFGTREAASLIDRIEALPEAARHLGRSVTE